MGECCSWSRSCKSPRVKGNLVANVDEALVKVHVLQLQVHKLSLT